MVPDVDLVKGNHQQDKLLEELDILLDMLA